MSIPSDGELLRFIGHSTLGHIGELIGEGLRPEAVEEVNVHATALTDRAVDLDVQLDRGHRHAFGLWRVLVTLPGPVAQTLVSWVEEVLGSTLPAGGHHVAADVDPGDVGEPDDPINRALAVLREQRDADPAQALQLLLRWSTGTAMGIVDVADLVVAESRLLRQRDSDPEAGGP